MIPRCLSNTGDSTQDRCPDPELFATAGVLARKFHLDYLLVHPVVMDYVRETYCWVYPFQRR